MTKKTYQGFTLVELLIVIAILSILSTLGFANFMSARIKARDLGRKSDLQTIAKSLEAYVNDHRSYPLGTAEGKIICKATTGTACNWGTSFTDESGTVYAALLPNDTNSAQNYYYVSNGTSYTIYTKLDNTQDIAIIPEVDCGTKKCNYKVSSSNIQ